MAPDARHARHLAAPDFGFSAGIPAGWQKPAACFAINGEATCKAMLQ
jgi:hypothetical protein